MPAPMLGPVLSATILTKGLDHSTGAWCEHLHQKLVSSGTLCSEEAEWLGWPRLAGARTAWLANEVGEPWLRFIESHESPLGRPFERYGWLSLEIAVQDVDRLDRELTNAPFELIGAPADLEFSDSIRAMQLTGPSGEVLYLTQVKAETPPFQLPFARCPIDRLFIPVLLAPNRESALAQYEQLSGNKGMTFETKVTVLNRARGLPQESRHPVATIQLRGCTLVELDQVAGLQEADFDRELPATGIAFVSFGVDKLPPDLPAFRLLGGPHAGSRAARLRGAAGEIIELIENTGEK